MDERSQTIDTILQALLRNELTFDQLTARHLGGLVGRTTGHLYHHFGSLDGLLFQVSQAGFQQLAARVLGAFQKTLSFEDMAVAFVSFGLAQPTLYALMFEYRFDWAQLRQREQLPAVMPAKVLFDSFQSFLRQQGVDDPAEALRLVIGGLHGQVSLALSGRANIGAMERTDSDVACSAARKLVQLVLQKPQKESSHAKPKSPAATSRSDAQESLRQGSVDGAPGQRKRRPR